MEAVMSNPAAFGARLRALRLQHDLTLEQLSHLVGITLLTLHRYETGVRFPQWDVAVRLADALGVKPNDFLEPDEPPPEPPTVRRGQKKK